MVGIASIDQGGKKLSLAPILIVKYIFQFIIWIIIFLVGLMFLYFVITAFVGEDKMPQTDYLIFDYGYNALDSLMSNIGVKGYLQKGALWITSLGSERKQAELLQESYGWKSTIDENSRNEELGVKIESFNFDKKVVNLNSLKEDEKISVDAKISAYALEPIDIEFSCLNRNGELAEAYPKYIRVNPNFKTSTQIKCNYDPEIFEVDEEDEGDSQKISIRAEYEFITEGYLPLYIVEEGSVTQNEIEKFFDEINDKNINGVTKVPSSTYTKGPIKLILESHENQPISEGKEYNLNLRIDNPGATTTGSLKHVDEIEILTTPEIELKSTEDLTYIGNEEGMEKYKVNSEKIIELNNICDEEIYSFFVDEKCWEKGRISMSVQYSVVGAGEEIEEAPIRARVKYIYEDEKFTDIILLRV